MAKRGSKMTARYKESMGESDEAAMIEPSWGRRALFLLKDLCSLSVTSQTLV
jgi:hypothetical protein